ncbi:hypothetical protein C8J57DRAFT_1493710 [Mycena rebaudengoi]|nr:hypothetical protein C8J57DRAFT_1493710 [Mycena rebaudengoi]
MFSIKSILFIAFVALMASTQVSAIGCTPCLPQDPRALSEEEAAIWACVHIFISISFVRILIFVIISTQDAAAVVTLQPEQEVTVEKF